MRHALICLAVIGCLAAPQAPTARADSYEVQQKSFPRVRDAFRDQEADWRARFRDSLAAWPPREVYLRAYKAEGELELWAASDKGDEMPLVRVHTFPICAASGDLGLKRRSGDGQVPEGFYRINRFNPHSSYLLSLGLDYPNAWDKARASQDKLSAGGDIFIHGSCVTIGCLPLGDAAIQGLYLVAVKAKSAGQRTIHIAVSPCRFGEAACEARLKDLKADPDTKHVHQALRVAEIAFGVSRRRPEVNVTRKGYNLRIGGR